MLQHKWQVSHPRYTLKTILGFIQEFSQRRGGFVELQKTFSTLDKQFAIDRLEQKSVDFEEILEFLNKLTG